MEDEIREQAKKDVEQIWENKLKKSFTSQINECLAETLQNLKNELNNFDNSINSHIQELDKKFEEKWKPTFLNFQNEMSKLSVINNKNNEIHNNNPYIIQFNHNKNNINNINENNINENNINDNNNNENEFKILNNENEFNIHNNENEFNNNNPNKFNIHNNNENDFNIINNEKMFNINENYINNNDVDNYENLRQKNIEFHKMNNPPFTNLVLLENSNPLINIVLQSLSNISNIVCYYLNPEKEIKILKKSKNDPTGNYLGPSFLKLLDYLWKSNQKEYSPNEIHDSLRKIMKNNYNSDDAGFIIKNILNHLNEELISAPIINNENDDPMDVFNRDLTLNKFITNLNQNPTIFTNRFYSVIETKKRCSNCNADFAYYSYFFEATPVIDIYLEANEENYFKLSLEEHLNFLLTNKENQNTIEQCIFCASEQKKLVSRNILTTSEILIVNINRKKDKNNTISFNYPLEFSGKKIIMEKNQSFDYELIAIIKLDNHNNNREYSSIYKSFIDKKWYKYNNTKIELVQNNQNIIFDDKNTSVLIYKKK